MFDYLYRPPPLWTSPPYDPYRYSNVYNTTPTKETTPVTSSTLNDMTVVELEALAERTANTLREKKAAADVVKISSCGYTYTFNRTTKKLYKYEGAISVFQSVFDEFFRITNGNKADCETLAAVFTAITPKS